MTGAQACHTEERWDIRLFQPFTYDETGGVSDQPRNMSQFAAAIEYVEITIFVSANEDLVYFGFAIFKKCEPDKISESKGFVVIQLRPQIGFNDLGF